MKKMVLAIVLAVACVGMLVAGIFTIVPNFRAVRQASSAPDAAADASHDTALDPALAELLDSAENYSPMPGGEPASAAPESSAPETPSSVLPPQTQAPPALSTTQRPSLEDFAWYTENVRQNGVPDGVAVIDEIAPVSGGWKALILYDPNNEYNSYAVELLNVSIEGTAEELTVILDWYQIIWGGAIEPTDETDMEDSVFSGNWAGAGLWASGPGTIYLMRFYEQNGAQYAVGRMDTPSGVPALLALMRP